MFLPTTDRKCIQSIESSRFRWHWVTFKVSHLLSFQMRLLEHSCSSWWDFSWRRASRRSLGNMQLTVDAPLLLLHRLSPYSACRSLEQSVCVRRMGEVDSHGNVTLMKQTMASRFTKTLGNADLEWRAILPGLSARSVCVVIPRDVRRDRPGAFTWVVSSPLDRAS